MEITIVKKSNGIHDYVILDAKNIKTKYDLELLKKLTKVVQDFNAKEIREA
jgi:hypothetical protein